MLLRRDTSSDTTVIRIETITVTSSLSLAASYEEITLTVTALGTLALTGASRATLAELQTLKITLTSASLSYSQLVGTALVSLSTGTSSTASSATATTSSSLELYSGSLDTSLGLAIGIPMGVVALIAVVCFGWVVFGKVRSRLGDVLTLEPKEIDMSKDPSKVEWVPESRLPKRNLLKRLSQMVEWPASPASFRAPILRRFHLLVPTKLPAPTKVLAPTKLPAPAPPDKPSAERVVVRPYTKRLSDELLLAGGEKVTLIKAHLDGWALVLHEGVEGVVPMGCLRPV